MFFMAVLVLFLSFLFKISFWEWLIIVLLIGLVLVLEILNTAIEKLLNFVSPGLSDQARVIKDLSASAVLIICLFSSIIGLLIFLPKLIFLF